MTVPCSVCREPVDDRPTEGVRLEGGWVDGWVRFVRIRDGHVIHQCGTAP